MARSRSGRHVPIRLVFELEREDDPRLYDDLIGFNKGQRRVNRLRTLAHDGALASNGGVLTPTVREAAVEVPTHGQTNAGAAMTGLMFEAPVSE